MPASLTSLLAAAALAAVTASLPAQAGGNQYHVMTVALPDGGTARIAYRGDVAPQVVLAPAPGFASVVPPVAAPEFGMIPSFAALEQVSAAMERQADAMLREAAAFPAFTPPHFARAGSAGMPQGMQVYTVESTVTGDGACTRRTEITYGGEGVAPKEVSSASGDCGVASQRVTPAAQPHVDQPRVIEARAQTDYRPLVKQALW